MVQRSAAATTCIMIFALLGVVRPVSADDAAATMQSMQDFLHNTPDCAEFTDQCSFCKLADGETTCSTPSTACIKKDYVCTRKAAD